MFKTMTDGLSKNFSARSLERSKDRKLREVASSLNAGWTSLLVQTFDDPAQVKEFEAAPIPDLSLVMIVSELREIKSFSGSTRRKISASTGSRRKPASAVFILLLCSSKPVGATPHQYLIRLRLERAAELLTKTDLSVQMIATSCGFVALSHFSGAFQRHFGQTASECRRAAASSTQFKHSR